MATKVEIPDLAKLSKAFGSLGLKVGPRTGPNKRTQDSKEWYVLRRFLMEALRIVYFKAPLSVQKINPPDPDFLLASDATDSTFIEITEATDPRDQKEMTNIELCDKGAVLIGEFGGRFSGGASHPEYSWASDIETAIARKSTTAICMRTEPNRHLVIYPNSNASALLFGVDDERQAFKVLANSISAKRNYLIEKANGCLIHVLAKNFVCFDLLGELRLVKRNPERGK